MFITPMEIDAMQYASISRELLRGDNILHLFDNGQPYLDKPPLIFWITALFFKFLGSSDFVYRLPSILFSLILIYSTYGFSKLYYSEKSSQISALILSSSQALFIMNADVRTDIYMIGPMMVAIWQLSAYFINHQWKNLIIGCVAIALAMMGKGPLGVVIPLTLLILNLLFNGDIKHMMDNRLLIGCLIFIICLIPMSYGLYTQFGFHGLEFFYWTQSFGRITGHSSWNNSTGPFYLFNVFLYAFLPWTFICIIAILDRLRDIIKKRYVNGMFEIVSFFGFFFPMIILSTSNYKLPHYIYCVTPFASILTAVKIEEWYQKRKYLNILLPIQFTLISIMIIFVYVLTYYVFGIDIFFVTIPLIIIISFSIIWMRIKNKKSINILLPSVAVSILCNYGINLGMIKPLLKFQSQSQAAYFIKENGYDDFEIYLYNENLKAKSRSFNFYLDRDINYINLEFIDNKINPKPELVYTNELGMHDLIDNNYNFEVLRVFDHIRVSKLNALFINPLTRAKVVQKKYLLRLVWA